MQQRKKASTQAASFSPQESHRERSIEVWTREHDSWVSTITREGSIALLASIDARLDVRDVYEAAADPAH